MFQYNWIQMLGSYPVYKRRRVSAFIIDETLVQIDNKHTWVWICIKPIHKIVLGIHISDMRNMLVLSHFLESLTEKYSRHTVYSDGVTWYPEACTFLNLKHRLHSTVEKSLIERVIQYFKDRTENFDDYHPCCTNKKKKNCDLKHVYNWIRLFMYLYNTTIRNKVPFVNGGELILS